MAYTVQIQKTFRVQQGLKSPVRAGLGLASLDSGFSVILRVGIAFDESQLKASGWFVDSDAVEVVIEEYCKYLSSNKWTDLFDFRPTFELVARHTLKELASKINQLSYVELENSTIGVKTRYSKDTN